MTLFMIPTYVWQLESSGRLTFPLSVHRIRTYTLWALNIDVQRGREEVGRPDRDKSAQQNLGCTCCNDIRFETTCFST